MEYWVSFSAQGSFSHSPPLTSLLCIISAQVFALLADPPAMARLLSKDTFAAVVFLCLSAFTMAFASAGAFVHHSSQSCLSCHTFTGFSTSTFESSQLASAEMSSANCRVCHASGEVKSELSPAHKIARDLYHANAENISQQSSSDVCMNCHGSSTKSSWKAETSGQLPLHSAASHAYGVIVKPGMQVYGASLRQSLDYKLPLFNGKMECATCHLLTAGTDDLLISYENPYDLCFGCHTFAEEAELLAR